MTNLTDKLKKGIAIGAITAGSILGLNSNEAYAQNKIVGVTSYDESGKEIVLDITKIHRSKYAFEAPEDLTVDNLETEVKILKDPTVYNDKFASAEQTYEFKKREIEQKEDCNYCDGKVDNWTLKLEGDDKFGITASALKNRKEGEENLPYLEEQIRENLENKLFAIKIGNLPGYAIYNGENATDSTADFCFIPKEGSRIGVNTQTGVVNILSKGGFYDVVLKDNTSEELQPIFSPDYHSGRIRVENRLGTMDTESEAYVPEEDQGEPQKEPSNTGFRIKSEAGATIPFVDGNPGFYGALNPQFTFGDNFAMGAKVSYETSGKFSQESSQEEPIRQLVNLVTDMHFVNTGQKVDKSTEVTNGLGLSVNASYIKGPLQITAGVGTREQTIKEDYNSKGQEYMEIGGIIDPSSVTNYDESNTKITKNSLFEGSPAKFDLDVSYELPFVKNLSIATGASYVTGDYGGLEGKIGVTYDLNFGKSKKE